MSTVKNKIAFLLLVLMAGLFNLSPAQVPPQPQVDFRHQNVSVELKRGNFSIRRFHYPNQREPSFKVPKAVILFASGGGGWNEWEEKVCDNLRKDGYEILGVDVHIYAQSDYDLDTLQQDFQTLAQFGLRPYGEHPPPLIIGGWSSGAEQAVAIGGGPHPPTGLVGLLLISPGSWGGYGWYAANDVGPHLMRKGTFDLTDFAPKLTYLRIVQWHAGLDLLDSRSWLNSLKGPHREYDLSYAIHDYDGASDAFLGRLNESLSWVLNQNSDMSASDNPSDKSTQN
jgi:phosphatidylglycerol lysyltransferase